MVIGAVRELVKLIMSAPVEVPPFSCLPPTTVVQVPGPAGSAASVTNAAVLAALATPLPIANGGTGQATQALALAAILGASAVPLANGGTAATTKAGAQTALGLGQNPQSVYGSILGLTIPLSTDPDVTVSGASLTVSSAGVYLVMGNVTVQYAGATFSPGQLLYLKARNITGAADIATGNFWTGAITTATYPSLQYSVMGIATIAASDVIKILCSLGALPSVGTATIFGFQFAAIPLRLS